MGNGNDSTETAAGLLGVSALAAKLGIGKSTISKHAAAGKIPIAKRDDKGRPLFDLARVRIAREDLSELMRRREGAAEEAAAETDDTPAGDQTDLLERRSDGPPRAPSALQAAALTEKQLKGRKLLGELAQREGLTVLRSIVELDQTTIARRTRDAVTGGMADKASSAYAFAGTPRTEADWRVWLAERVREVFNAFEATLALEDDDEFTDEPAVTGSAGQPSSQGDP